MAIKRYTGKNYLFEVESTPEKRKVWFTIIAIDRVSGHFSHDNNVNGILGQFDFKEDDPRMEESDWLLSAKEGQSFQATADRMFKSKSSLKYIESALNADRIEGEWANVRPLE